MRNRSGLDQTLEDEPMTPQRRWDIINNKVRGNPRYEGNPDEVPLQSDEFHFFARLMYKLSAFINARVPFAEYYESDKGLSGVLARQVCRPPCFYKEPYQKHERKRLPARICLRPLASHFAWSWAGILLALSWLFGSWVLVDLVFYCFSAWCCYLFYLVVRGDGHKERIE